MAFCLKGWLHNLLWFDIWSGYEHSNELVGPSYLSSGGCSTQNVYPHACETVDITAHNPHHLLSSGNGIEIHAYKIFILLHMYTVITSFCSKTSAHGAFQHSSSSQYIKHWTSLPKNLLSETEQLVTSWVTTYYNDTFSCTCNAINQKGRVEYSVHLLFHISGNTIFCFLMYMYRTQLQVGAMKLFRLSYKDIAAQTINICTFSWLFHAKKFNARRSG